MKQIVYHIIIPTIVTAVFFVIALMPVEMLGCRTRGLMALLVAFLAVWQHWVRESWESRERGNYLLTVSY